MDGVAGITQDAVQPGETFTYRFEATVPGTYWYHSHQDSAEQVDKGLYGTLVVEPKEDSRKPDRDYVLVLDEWRSGNDGENGMGGMHHPNGDEMDHEQMDGYGMHGDGMDHMEDYDTFTINGRVYEESEPLLVKEGDRVRLRLVNAGFMKHSIHIHGHDFKVTDLDGQPLNQPQTVTDQLIPIAPGERVDVEFTADNPGNWLVEAHGDGKGIADMKIPIRYEGAADSKTDPPEDRDELSELDWATYGQTDKSAFSLDEPFDQVYRMELDEKMEHGKGMKYTINGETMEETAPLVVKKGDRVKVTLENKGEQDHPMHLHGHFFHVLSKNGNPLSGSPVIKDTLNVQPGESYEVAFEADNPGDWMFHCHELHHAAGGMAQVVKYQGYDSFQPDPDAGNIPE
jgi:FtsP/CotA-like multicopper oxidase with cupredoxin domain